MTSTQSEINAELRLAAAEHSHSTARMEKLKATVADQSLSREARLVAQMRLDKIFFDQRSRQQSFAEEGDKITTAKKRSERKRLARERLKRIAAGLPIRPRHGHPLGIWASNDSADSLTATDGRCVVCGGRINRDRSRTCSATCARTLRRAKAFVNHKEAGSGRP